MMKLNRITFSVPRSDHTKYASSISANIHRLIVSPVWIALNSRVHAHVEDQLGDQIPEDQVGDVVLNYFDP